LRRSENITIKINRENGDEEDDAQGVFGSEVGIEEVEERERIHVVFVMNGVSCKEGRV